MSLLPLCEWKEIHKRLAGIFPSGTPAREHAIWEIAAKTIFVMLYVGAVEGSGRWLRPDQVTRMTDKQAARIDEAARLKWTKDSMRSDKRQIPKRWYAVNMRESIRDDTIRYSLIPTGSVIARPGLTTTSPAGRYALQGEFADLFDPALTESSFEAKASAWRDKHLNAGQLHASQLCAIGRSPAASTYSLPFRTARRARCLRVQAPTSPGRSSKCSRRAFWPSLESSS
ncbi:MAG TPA: hypothetical protein VHY79_13440 [Rhizomicrobium sp.]|nr:hypothetical protein [Rhizomicrobium sp.]